MPAARRTLQVLPVAAAALLALSACGGASSAEEAPAAQGTWGSMADSEPHLILSGGGELQGHDGCNSLTGTWTADGSTVEFSELGATEMACPDVDTWLHDARSGEIEGDELVVKNGDGEEIGTLERVDG